MTSIDRTKTKYTNRSNLQPALAGDWCVTEFRPITPTCPFGLFTHTWYDKMRIYT